MPDIDGFSLVENIRRDPRLSSAAIVMLTSGGRRGDAARCRELGVAAYLTKPVGYAELRSAIIQALGPTIPTPQSARPAQPPFSRPLRILFAEDNLVNQKVVTRLLEKRGHRVDVVAKGRAAVDRVSRGGLDLVLMDVQMPGMDGLEATAAIRKLEGSGTHVPIIALTAHAMKTDQHRCAAAGMDGYLSKPIHAEDLYRQIERFCPRHPELPERQESADNTVADTEDVLSPR